MGHKKNLRITNKKRIIDFFNIHQTVLFYNFSYKDNNNTGFNITMSSYTLKHSQNLTVTISNVLKNCLATKMKCQRPSRLLEVCWTF